ncbi:SPC25 [Sanghuangporus sanghuang]
MAAVVGNARPIDLASILESQNPVIDLRIEEFERTSRRFLKAVTAYTARALEEIAQRRTRHAAEMKRIAERTAQVEAEIQTCKVKEIELMEVLEKEQAEKREAESAVSELKRQFASIKEKCASVDAEIEQYTDEVNNLRKDKQKDVSVLDTCASRLSPELKDMEERLQFDLEGVGQDKLLLRFLRIDPVGPQREFSIVIDASDRLYHVPLTTPPIPTLPLLVDQLNKTRDLFAFIKSLRARFVEMVDGAR